MRYRTASDPDARLGQRKHVVGILYSESNFDLRCSFVPYRLLALSYVDNASLYVQDARRVRFSSLTLQQVVGYHYVPFCVFNLEQTRLCADPSRFETHHIRLLLLLRNRDTKFLPLRVVEDKQTFVPVLRLQDDHVVLVQLVVVGDCYFVRS